MRTLAAVALVLMLVAVPALSVDTVAIDGFDYWLYGYTHLSSAEVDTINPGFTPDRWWVEVDSLDVTVWCYPASGDTALSPVGNTMLIRDGEGMNFDTSVGWIKVKAETGEAGQLRYFFVGHSE